ncbi:Response regulator PleD [Paraliobacillus sp. PM-2]|uniref:diguanylate cyclase n=1 Tax=Paraliobacillus sp. PM-2 TaxID=1462524 RepID=UPI00061C794C|nr:diguanylate cyclase [Paraliobacillus sp. PM-2]CQR47517.1 Response regulator PleD [Paraliobacillus sp. PM-2]
MDLDKYKQLLFNKIKKQAIEWFESGNQKSIPNEEVNRFLHSIKGTSGTLQLDGLFHIASDLLDDIKESKEKTWINSELSEYLYPLLQLSYEYENFKQEVSEELNPIIERNEKAPLIHLIDDDVSMLILLKDTLEEQGCMVLANTDPVKATNQYFDILPDCLVIDLDIPAKNGFEILQDIHEHNEKQFIPKVIMSASQGRKERIDAFKMGADDFIGKPIDMEEFIVRVSRHLQRKRLFDQSVLIDELTQVYNRKLLSAVYQRQLENASVRNNPFTIVMLDIDHFKKINDTYGHSAGDRILHHFAQFLSKHVTNEDTIFRYGGEEFVIIFSNTSYKEVQEKINKLIKDYGMIEHEEKGHAITLTFSAGLFTVFQEEIPLSDAIEKADQALYKAKEKGRARVEIANDFSKDTVKKKLYISIIDDDIIIRTILTKILNNITLKRAILDIEVFEDGSKFMEKKRHEIQGTHFILLDGVMPVMDGMEVLQKLKGLDRANDFHILMLTSRKGENDIARALSLGADDYITKPFSVTELQARIQRLLQRIE